MVDRYNKHTNDGPGTLVGNWHEEKALRELTGFGRSEPFEHIPKKDGEPMKIKGTGATVTRIHGELWEDTLKATNHEYGTCFNKASTLRKVGRREELLRQEIEADIQREFSQTQMQKDEEAKRRLFDTTNRTDFAWKNTTEPVGRRVMKTQDGGPAEATDDQFAMEHKLRPRTLRQTQHTKQA
mmetsp:Transcript_32215/g.55702  ORF Transcript_32215/g.55702 Transcript_32215/m.55702 type:complete len:183 (-) Transcript_32215:74-622(-)